MDFIESFVNKLYKLSPDALEKFKALFVEKKYKKGQKMVSTGETPENFYIIKSGIARSFFLDDNGKERIRSLFIPVSSFGSMSLINNQPSEHSYDCLSDCTVYELNYKGFTELSEKSHEFALFQIKLLQASFLKVIGKINDLSSMSATERYLKLKEDIPNIDNLIQQYHIAAYLNISPVQLSRIRKELYSK